MNEAPYGYEDEEVESAKEAVESIAVVKDEMIGDFQTTFGTPQGLKVLKYLMQRCRQNAPTYVLGNPTHTAHLEGRRWVILHILEYVHGEGARFVSLPTPE